MAYESLIAANPGDEAAGLQTPIIFVHSDGCAFPDVVKNDYETINGPKELVWADGNHFDYYDSPAQIDNAVQNITRFFNQYLSLSSPYFFKLTYPHKARAISITKPIKKSTGMTHMLGIAEKPTDQLYWTTTVMELSEKSALS